MPWQQMWLSSDTDLDQEAYRKDGTRFVSSCGATKTNNGITLYPSPLLAVHRTTNEHLLASNNSELIYQLC